MQSFREFVELSDISEMMAIIDEAERLLQEDMGQMAGTMVNKALANPMVKAKLNQVITQVAAENPHHPAVQKTQGDTPESKAAAAIDALHMGLDVIGVGGDAVIPGSGVVADGLNAVLYLVRAMFQPGQRKDHLFNAGISLLSMIPFIGDAAKIPKYAAKMGKGAASFSKAARLPSRARLAGRTIQDYARNTKMQRAANYAGNTDQSQPAMAMV